MKIFILIVLYVLIAIVVGLTLIAYEYKNDRVFKDVDEYIECRLDDIMKNFILGAIWPAFLTGGLFVWSMCVLIKFILGKINRKDD